MTPRRTAITDREEAVVLLIAEGLSYAEIGQALGIAPRTVKAHARSAREKLAAASNGHAVALLIRARVAVV